MCALRIMISSHRRIIIDYSCKFVSNSCCIEDEEELVGEEDEDSSSVNCSADENRVSGGHNVSRSK